MDLRIFLSCIFISLVLHVVFSDSSSFIDLSTLDYSIRQTFHTRNIQFTFNSNMASMKINCSKCHGQRHVTCQENDFINVAIQLQGSKQTISVPFNVSCSIRSDSKNTFIVDPINTSSKNNEIFVNWTRPSSTIKEYLVYCMTSTTHQYQQISTNQISFDNLSENTWHQVCIASIDNLWRTSQFTCRHVLTNVSANVTTTKYITTSTTTSNTAYTSWLSVNSTYKIPVLNRPTWSLYAVPIVAVAIGLMFLACFSIAIRKLKVIIQCPKIKKQNEISPLSIKLKRIKQNDIDVKEFTMKYACISADRSNPLIVEYNRLNADTQVLLYSLGFTTQAGQDPINACKNRFINILPYDHNRVHLKSKKAPFDYINASYIPFKSNENEYEYITTQNPIETTISDFWEMIWTQNIYSILMIERNIQGEYFKCLQYWPSHVGDTDTYGPKNVYEVTFLNENKMASHIERLFAMKDTKSGATRRITKFQIYSWFDHKIPDYEDFDNFLYRFTSLTGPNLPRPVVVHCSAGAGLTGVMICVDRIVRELINGCQKLNIYDTVLSMRLYRHCMIQRQNQYNFIYGYINYFITKYMVTSGKELVVSMKLWGNL